MESGSLPAIPAPQRQPPIMPRNLLLSFAILTLALTCSAQTAKRAVGMTLEVGDQRLNSHASTTAGPSAGDDSAAENELLQSANKSRELAGVPPLRMEESLRAAARAHAQRMVASEQLEHQLSGEPSLMQRIALSSEAMGLKLDRAGENIAYAASAPKVNDALMHSAPHRENLLDRGFNVAGIAAIWSKGRLYVVQDFAHEVPSYSAQQSGKLIGRAVGEMRQQAGLSQLIQLTPAKLDEAACCDRGHRVSLVVPSVVLSYFALGRQFPPRRREGHDVLILRIRKPGAAVIHHQMPFVPCSLIVFIDDAPYCYEGLAIVDALGANLNRRTVRRQIRNLADFLQVDIGSNQDRLAVFADSLHAARPAKDNLRPAVRAVRGGLSHLRWLSSGRLLALTAGSKLSPSLEL